LYFEFQWEIVAFINIIVFGASNLSKIIIKNTEVEAQNRETIINSFVEFGA
jgi:hypothetical protein